MMSRFQKRHYELLAVAMNETMEESTEAEQEILAAYAMRMADLFEDDNPLFDRQRFGKRCGIFTEGGKGEKLSFDEGGHYCGPACKDGCILEEAT
jgi:hypothetical protein